MFTHVNPGIFFLKKVHNSANNHIFSSVTSCFKIISSEFFISCWPSPVSVLRFVSLMSLISYYRSLPRFKHAEVIKLTNVWKVWRAPDGLQLNKEPWKVFQPWKSGCPHAHPNSKCTLSYMCFNIVFILCWHILYW